MFFIAPDNGIMVIPQSQRNVLRVTALYDLCYNITPVELQAEATGSHQFRVNVVTIHQWGFLADITRLGTNGGWGKDKGNLAWTALFGRSRTKCQVNPNMFKSYRCCFK